MTLMIEIGKVVEAKTEYGNVQELKVKMADGSLARAIHYTDALHRVAVGDHVALNVTAVRLGLNSGGVHFVHHVLDRSVGCAGEMAGGADTEAYAEAAADAEADADHSAVGDVEAAAQGHIMKLRYTPQQRAVLAVEEEASPHHELFRSRLQLDGMPVLIGELHSMLPIAAAWLMAGRHAGPTGAEGRIAPSDEAVSSAGVVGGVSMPLVAVGSSMVEARGVEPLSTPSGSAYVGTPSTSSGLRLAYVMTDGGALPLAYSRHAAELTACGWLAGTVTYGHAYGGNLEAVNKFTALLAARHVHMADIAIATMGPGIVGTGTRLGHTATETAELVHAVLALGGRPILMPRISFADARERHRGLSAHTLTALGDLCLAPATMPLPAELPPEARACIERQIAEADLASLHYIPVVTGMDPFAIAERMAAYALPITTMGRRFVDDPPFWAGVCAAAQYARGLLEGG